MSGYPCDHPYAPCPFCEVDPDAEQYRGARMTYDGEVLEDDWCSLHACMKTSCSHLHAEEPA